MLYSHRNVKTQQHEFALEAASFWATQNLWGKRHQLDFCKVILAISILFFFLVVFSVREHATQRAPFCIQDFVPSLKNELTPLGILPLFDTQKEAVHFSSSWPTKKEKVYGFMPTSSLFILFIIYCYDQKQFFGQSMKIVSAMLSRLHEDPSGMGACAGTHIWQIRNVE